jgi:hypothetical protein
MSANYIGTIIFVAILVIVGLFTWIFLQGLNKASKEAMLKPKKAPRTTCLYCGYNNEEKALKCSHCGAPLQKEEPKHDYESELDKAFEDFLEEF